MGTECNNTRIHALPTKSETLRGNCFATGFSWPFLPQDGGATGGAVPVACLAAGGGMNMGKYVWD